MNVKGLRNYSTEFSKYLPNPCSMPGTVLGTRDTRMNKTVSALKKSGYSVGRQHGKRSFQDAIIRTVTEMCPGCQGAWGESQKGLLREVITELTLKEVMQTFFAEPKIL